MPRPINVLMIGAGSFFTTSVLKDVVLIPDNAGGELRLVDINPERLDLTATLMNKILGMVEGGERWSVKASTNRNELLPGVDYIVNAIEVSGTAKLVHARASNTAWDEDVLYDRTQVNVEAANQIRIIASK